MQDTPNPQSPTRGGNDDGTKPKGFRKHGDAAKKGEETAAQQVETPSNPG